HAYKLQNSHPLYPEANQNPSKISHSIITNRTGKQSITMVATNLKSETKKLMDKRSAIEAEMDAIVQRLSQPGGPGLSGSLVDDEGFPKTDIDIPVVRADRHRFAELRNDHKQITKRIGESIELLHSARLAPKTSSIGDSDYCFRFQGTNDTSSSDNAAASATAADSSTSMDVDAFINIPFAVIDEIADASPTAEDGLQLGDQMVKFGNVEYQAGENLLQKLASEAQANQDQAVSVVVLRQGSPTNITVTPRQWQGRGLLG
ncbi:26S proteasome non-ATPase regulatory subunit 9, partial [Linum perenne]